MISRAHTKGPDLVLGMVMPDNSKRWPVCTILIEVGGICCPRQCVKMSYFHISCPS